ncbi:MAG: endonuclease III [Holosporales bacterium]|jgi:endonuclease-3|nr:endonuclease III [Holosporales bacterium]
MDCNVPLTENLRSRHEEIGTVFKALRMARPDASIELKYTNTFTLLVAVILSAQAKDARVNAVTNILFTQFSTPQEVLALGIETFERQVRTIGLYKVKSKNIFKMSEILVDKFHGCVPNTREELETLPGVGRKTAHVVLNVAFGQPVIAVDTHVFRVAHLLGLSTAKTPERVGEDLERCIPEEYLQQAHHLLVLHGRYVCTAHAPRCVVCVVRKWCTKEQGIS